MNASCACSATLKCVFETCVNLENRTNDIKRFNSLILVAFIYEHVKLRVL